MNTSEQPSIPRANDEKVLVSPDSPYKAEDIELLSEPRPASKAVVDFPELDELAKQVDGYLEEDPVSPTEGPWELPVSLQSQIIGKSTIKTYTPRGEISSFPGHFGSFTLAGEGRGHFRILFQREVFAKFLQLFSVHGPAASRITRKDSKVLLKFMGMTRAKKPVRGIKEKKVAVKLEEIGVRIVEVKLQVIKGTPVTFKSPWSYLGTGGKTLPDWKLTSIMPEPSGEPDFIWVDVNYEP
jgi:hypothetical protein